MRIHRISVRDFRGIEERTVEFPEHDVTIIEGENEAGKSSLIEALFLLIDYQDNSGHRDVRSVRPVHTGKSPVVEAEISSGPYRFVYEKCFGTSASQRRTKLTILEPRREQITGVEAHERVAKIIAETTDDALWRALRLQQGVSVQQEQLLVGRSLGAALDAAAGAPAAGDRENTIYERVESEYHL